MNSTIILIIFGLTSIYYIYYLVSRSKSEMKDFNIDKEQSYYERYKKDFLENDFYFLKKWLNDKPIDAFTMGSIPETKLERFKRVIINGIKDIALRAVGIKRTRVYTNNYWVLSGDDLHFFTTDVNGKYDSRTVFNSFKLEKASMEFTGAFRRDLGLINIYGNKLDKNLPQTYTITFHDTESKDLSIQIHDRLAPIGGSITEVFNVKKQVDRHKKNMVVGHAFLKLLKSKYPNLDTA